MHSCPMPAAITQQLVANIGATNEVTNTGSPLFLPLFERELSPISKTGYLLSPQDLIHTLKQRRRKRRRAEREEL
jgi:hypothetical protein